LSNIFSSFWRCSLNTAYSFFHPSRYRVKGRTYQCDFHMQILMPLSITGIVAILSHHSPSLQHDGTHEMRQLELGPEVRRIHALEHRVYHLIIAFWSMKGFGNKGIRFLFTAATSIVTDETMKE